MKIQIQTAIIKTYIKNKTLLINQNQKDRAKYFIGA
jgi:hypothetical protein